MKTEMNLQRISVDKLKPAKYNPRKDLKPGDPAYEKIKRSLSDFGYVDPVIWNEVTGNIVGGHQRYKVLVAEGATEIDCVVVHMRHFPVDRLPAWEGNMKRRKHTQICDCTNKGETMELEQNDPQLSEFQRVYLSIPE